MLRCLVVGGCVALILAGCAASDTGSDVSTTSVDEPRTSVTRTETTTSSATIAPSTVPSSSTTVGTTSTTESMSYELELVWAPADGQWFIELPILFVFARFPPEDESVDEDWVMGARGWTRDEAVVAINGVPTDQEWCTGCLSQHGRVLEWRASDREGDLTDWEVGENTLTVAATFVDGTVIEESRTFHYDPTLEAFTGWMVELDEASQTITFAASTYGSAEEDGAETGPVTSVIEYPVRDDAAFILLGVDSSGQPPPSTLDFEEFTDLISRATAGECDDCFYGSWNDFLAEPDSEHGAEYFVIYLRDGEIQQLEQIWRP